MGIWSPPRSSLVTSHGLSLQVLFQNGKFQWKRLEKLIALAKEGSGGLDLSDTVRDGAKVVILDDKLRMQLLNALTEDNRLHVEVRVGCQRISDRKVAHPGGGGLVGLHWQHRSCLKDHTQDSGQQAAS